MCERPERFYTKGGFGKYATGSIAYSPNGPVGYLIVCHGDIRREISSYSTWQNQEDYTFGMKSMSIADL